MLENNNRESEIVRNEAHIICRQTNWDKAPFASQPRQTFWGRGIWLADGQCGGNIQPWKRGSVDQSPVVLEIDIRLFKEMDYNRR